MTIEIEGVSVDLYVPEAIWDDVVEALSKAVQGHGPCVLAYGDGCNPEPVLPVEWDGEVVGWVDLT